MLEIGLGSLDQILKVILLLGLSVYLRLLLGMMGQSWIKTTSHTATLALLPILTYVITSVISGNLALSLGMIGALSIVRFRNPVRSPLELSVYFGAITMGIAASVGIQWLLLLIGGVSLVAGTLFFLNIASKVITGKSFFTTSFSEGNDLSTLSVTAKSTIPALDDHEYLVSMANDDNQTNYTLASSNFDSLKQLATSLKLEQDVSSVQLNR